MGAKQLSKSEIKELNSTLSDQHGLEDFFSKKEKVVIDDDHLYRNDELVFFRHEEKWIPVLKLLLKGIFLKKVTVDMGAVRFMIKGADVLRPGVTLVEDEISEGDPIVIVDENHGKPLCVGIALFDSEGIRNADRGSIAKNIHYVGDSIWNS